MEKTDSRAVQLSAVPVYNPAPLPAAPHPLQQYPPQQYPPQQYPPPANYPMQQYPPIAPQSGYAPVVIGQSYPPPPPMAAPQVLFSQLPQAGVIIEEPFWDYANAGFCYRCTKLRRPQGDQLSVIAPAAVEYSPFIHAYMCHRTLQPFLVNGYYQVDWPTGHSLSAFTTQHDLEQVCDQCQQQAADQFRRVRSSQTKRYKRTFHILMVISDILIILGLLIWILGAWPGFVAILIGAGLEIFNRLWVMGKCRQECLLLSSQVAQILQTEVSRRPALAPLRLSVGAYATYLRFSFPQAGLQ